MNIKKSIIPAQKQHNFLKLSKIQNGKLHFSPTFQKVELHNSTFFQQTTTKDYVPINDRSFTKREQTRRFQIFSQDHLAL